ncbi:MAG: hypothetical protein RLZZ165_2504 [Bacteroidota bacterium]
MSSDVFHSAPHRVVAAGANLHRAGSATIAPGPAEAAETNDGQKEQRVNHGRASVSDAENPVENEKPVP